MKKFIFGLLWLWPMFLSGAQATCIWTVKGRLTVFDNLYVSSAGHSKGLQDVKVEVSATTLGVDLWASWGSTRTDKDGYYKIAIVPAQHSSWGCRLSRRLKIKANLSGAYARISPNLITDYEIQLGDTSVWHTNSDVNGRLVTISKYLNDTTDLRADMTQSYKDTRAAQMYLGYRELFLKLSQWNLNPGKAQMLWPSAVGFSPPGGWVHIHRNWFRHIDHAKAWHMNSEGGLNNYLWRWSVRELTHEYLHQWFYRNVYTPNFASLNVGSTHDFLESPSLTLFEEAAEFQAVHINKLVFNILDESKDDHLLSREGIRCHFENSRKKDGPLYFTLSQVDSMIAANSPEWRDYLTRANKAVASTLALLVKPDWYYLDFDSSPDSGSCLLRPAQSTASVLCLGFTPSMFTMLEIMDAFKNWRFAYALNSVPLDKRNVNEFYAYLAAVYPARFGAHKERFLRFGNPAYQDVRGENATDVCGRPLELIRREWTGPVI